jgi:hypothetical protein
MNALTTLAIGPYVGARVALLVVNLLGDEKGRYYSDSVTAALDKARDCASYPDTVVYVFDTDNNGEMRALPNARIQRDGVGPVRFYNV